MRVEVHSKQLFIINLRPSLHSKITLQLTVYMHVL